MTKELKQIQEENRKLILEAIHGCGYKEALKKELEIGCLISRYSLGIWGHLANKIFYRLDSFTKSEKIYNKNLVFSYIGFQKPYWGYVSEELPERFVIKEEDLINESREKYNCRTKIIGKPITLSKVLLTLKNKVFGNIDSFGKYHKMLFQNDKLLFVHSEGEFYWDLTQETLENQSEKTQTTINNLLTT